MFFVLINIAMQALKKLDIKKEELSSILDSLKGRADPDLKSIAVSFSNAVFGGPNYFIHDTENRATQSRKLGLPMYFLLPSKVEFISHAIQPKRQFTNI